MRVMRTLERRNYYEVVTTSRRWRPVSSKLGDRRGQRKPSRVATIAIPDVQKIRDGLGLSRSSLPS